MEENKFKLADIFAGIIIPLILVLLIYVLAVYVNVGGQYHVFGATNTIAVILVNGFASNDYSRYSTGSGLAME